MNTLPILALLLATAFVGSTHLDARGDHPTSKKTAWRIPSNSATPAAIDWLLVRHPDDADGPGHINLEAGIGEHHSYEIAWSYYTKRLGLDPAYMPENTRQLKRDANGERTFAKETTNDKGLFTIMGGQVGKYRLTLYLWTDKENPSLQDRVYVKMLFCP